MPTSTTSRLARSTGQVGAVLAVASAAAHLAATSGHGPAHTLLTVVMTGACLYCGWHLWNRPAVRDWASVAVMSVAMIALHQGITVPGGHGAHHHGAGQTMAMSTDPGPTMATGFAVVEALYATSVLFAITRTRGPRGRVSGR